MWWVGIGDKKEDCTARQALLLVLAESLAPIMMDRITVTVSSTGSVWTRGTCKTVTHKVEVKYLLGSCQEEFGWVGSHCQADVSRWTASVRAASQQPRESAPALGPTVAPRPSEVRAQSARISTSCLSRDAPARSEGAIPPRRPAGWARRALPSSTLRLRKRAFALCRALRAS
jgi:hypothetical protein